MAEALVMRAATRAWPISDELASTSKSPRKQKWTSTPYRV
jgi:hypothetical protein